MLEKHTGGEAGPSKNPDTIEQCKREGFSQQMQEQKNEGCQVYGFLEVSKVRDGFCCEPAA